MKRKKDVERNKKKEKKTKSYEFLPHTADVKFRAYGGTLEEAFENAAYALTDVVTNHKKVKPLVEKSISVKSENKEALLYDFLEQFLILLDSEGFLLHELKALKIKEENGKLRLSAKVVGDNNPSRYKIETSIKAVTYEEMFIRQEKGKWILQVILDI